MKKLLTVIVSGILAVIMLFSLVACGPKPRTEVEEKVMAASKMSLAELEAAAKEEFLAAGDKAQFVAKSPTSGVGKALTKFAEKYDWLQVAEFESGLKDNAMYTALDETVAKGNFWTDFALLQAGASYVAARTAGTIYNYAPAAADDLKLDGTDPYVALYTDKCFLYNKAAANGWELKNIWQLTKKDGKTLKACPAGVSFQDPTKELSNLSFLAMATSPKAVESLKKAYKSYFGEDYKEQKDYANIGYYFISEFIGNVTNRHGSDTTVISKDIVTDTKGIVYYAGLNKTKKYADGLEGHVWQDELYISGINAKLEGFDGFTYNFYTAIPSTSKLPYTACLFARYLALEEAFKAGWKDAGYYSANQLVPNNTAKANGVSKEYPMNTNTLMEDGNYILSVFNKVDTFVSSLWNKK